MYLNQRIYSYYLGMYVFNTTKLRNQSEVLRYSICKRWYCLMNYCKNQISCQTRLQHNFYKYVYLCLVTTWRNLCFWQKLKVKVDFEMLFINFQLTILSYYFDWMWLSYWKFWWSFYFCHVLGIISNKIYNTLVLTQMKDNFENEWISFVIISLYQWNCLKPGNYWKLFYYIQIKLK